MIGKRIVTAHKNGKSVFAEQQTAPNNAFNSVKGFNAAIVWGTSAKPETQWSGLDPAKIDGSIMPDIGETRLMIVTFPPDSIMAGPDFDPAAAGAEYLERLPGLAERFEQENPGMHTTDTVDYDIVLDGEITLELDDGAKAILKHGDVAIQNGTRHAWRNHSAKPATMAFVLIGAKQTA